MIEQFKNYIENFDIKNSDIKAKYNHSLRVMKLNEEYAKRLNFSKEDIEIAKIIGLLHDYGRFIQIKKYHTMQDKKIDHADYGVKLLFKDKEIEKFNIPKNYYDIIEFAIKNHNKLKIEKTKDERKLKHAKLIRDIDKLDIIFIFGYLNDFRLEMTNDKITSKVMESVKRHTSVNLQECQNPNDHIAAKLAFTYDINYDICFDKLKDNLEKFYQRLNKDIFKEAYEEVKKYIDERTDKNVR